jgi:hypothetical protein
MVQTKNASAYFGPFSGRAARVLLRLSSHPRGDLHQE